MGICFSLSCAFDFFFFFFNDTATTEIYTLSLHDALPISPASESPSCVRTRLRTASRPPSARSEEHTSELQSRRDLVCRLLLEKKTINLWLLNKIYMRADSTPPRVVSDGK